MNIVYYWLTLGPYHYARMNAVEQRNECDQLRVIEATDTDDHEWNLFPPKNFEHQILQPGKMLDNTVVKDASYRLADATVNGPCDILVNGAGYFHLSMLKPIMKLKQQGIKIILWSESTEQDQDRKSGKEFVKSLVLKVYDGAIVAGKQHKEYLIKLGMDAENICCVGNVVDNTFFASGVTDCSKRRGFIYVGRFLAIKNLERLILAYHDYRKKCARASITPEPLVLVGDGPTKKEIEQKVDELQLEGVSFTGQLQIDKIRRYYARNKVLILPSLSEPWGLVINEAMASGMAVIASDRCGAAHELVAQGKNGFTFNPLHTGELVEYMLQLTKNSNMVKAFGEHSSQIIQQYSPELYAKRCCQFFDTIMKTPRAGK